MAFSEEDLAQLGGFVKGLVSDGVAAGLAAMKEDLETAAVQSRDSIAGRPDVDPEAGPDFYVHLADGSVITTKDSASTHMPNADGETTAVIGRFQKGN